MTENPGTVSHKLKNEFLDGTMFHSKHAAQPQKQINAIYYKRLPAYTSHTPNVKLYINLLSRSLYLSHEQEAI